MIRYAAKSIALEEEYVINVDVPTVELVLGPPKFDRDRFLDNSIPGVVTGLAWTEYGGEILKIETVTMPGKGRMQITGKLGDVMQESVKAAKSFVRSKCLEYGIIPPLFEKKDFHIHVPEGATPKDVASLVTAQLLFLEAEDPKKEIYLYINSPGGLVTAGLGIYDTMQYVKPDISTLCIGQAASMGSFLLAAGTKGKRFSLPNSRVMVHQPSAGFQGQVTDIEIHANEVSSLKKRLNEIYSKHTGKSVDEVKSALERDNFMTAEVAKDFGLIDEVVEKRS